MVDAYFWNIKQVIIRFEDIDEVQLLLFFLSLIIQFHISVALKLTSGATVLLSLKIRRSQHAFINPAITIILRMGAGGHGVPPLGSPDG